VTSSWPALLDALEEQFRRQEAALRGEAEAPAGLALPTMEQPIPPGLVPRALSLLDRCRTLQDEVAVAVNRRRPPGRAYAGRQGRELGTL
jgi:hypothetical protein